MSVIDRLGQVVKSEWNSRFGKDDDKNIDKEAAEEVEAALKKEQPPSSASPSPSSATKPPRSAAVSDVEGALRVLELAGNPTLDEVRAQYRVLARRYHPKTTSERADEQNAAHVVLEALTDALEVLEEHLLPLPPQKT